MEVLLGWKGDEVMNCEVVLLLFFGEVFDCEVICEWLWVEGCW